MSLKFKNVGCIFDKESDMAVEAYDELISKYDFLIDLERNDIEDCDAIITLGGDGMVLQTMHKYMGAKVPIFGMNRGSVGFLLNKYNRDGLRKRLSNAISATLHPLEVTTQTQDGNINTALAINEVSLLRETSQSAHIKIEVNKQVRMEKLVGDGILLSTPAGSTAYNYAAHGPIIPLGTNLLALTPISPFRPRRWRGALLSHINKVKFTVLDSVKRPVSAVADSQEFRDVEWVTVKERSDITLQLLFDKDNMFQERVMKEQFST